MISSLSIGFMRNCPFKCPRPDAGPYFPVGSVIGEYVKIRHSMPYNVYDRNESFKQYLARQE
jgi:hypothetical protein